MADESNVVVLPVITRLDLPPERVLNAALARGLSEVVIVGVDKDGEEYFAASKSDGGDALWHLQRAAHKLLKIAD